MRKFLLLNIFSCIGASYFSPIAFNLGQEFAVNYVAKTNSNINFDDINVNYDLRLLFGDMNNDKEISSTEYKDFDFASLIENMQEWNSGGFTGTLRFKLFPNSEIVLHPLLIRCLISFFLINVFLEFDSDELFKKFCFMFVIFVQINRSFIVYLLCFEFIFCTNI